MPIKRIFLPLSNDEDGDTTVKAAFLLGKMFSAQVSGLFAQHFPIVRPEAGPAFIRAETLRRIEETIGKELAEAQKKAQNVFTGHARLNPEIDAQFASSATPVGSAIRHGAFLADISVVGRDGDSASSDRSEVRDALLFQSGRPVLLVPPTGIGEQNFDRIVIAWKESVEAVRAISAVQPFLAKASEVHLITVGDESRARDALDDAVQYLQLHYANIQSEIVPSSSQGVGETLLHYVRGKGNALLVMGAYSHWKWQERVFGGVTEDVMKSATMPLLMAH